MMVCAKMLGFTCMGKISHFVVSRVRSLYTLLLKMQNFIPYRKRALASWCHIGSLFFPIFNWLEKRAIRDLYKIGAL